MDLYALGFVLLMSAVGGLCAYVADILGYKIGKKRISFKRIRPKYVARTSVVIAGMLIPVLTIAILYGASAEYRTWLSKGRQAIEDLKKASQELEKVNQQRVQGEQEIARLTNARRVMEKELDKKQTEIGQKDQRLKEQLASLQTLQTRLTSLSRMNESIQRKFQNTQAAYTKTVKAYEELQKNLKKTNEDYLAAKARGDQAKTRYDEISKKNLELTNDNGRLEGANKALEDSVKDLQTKTQELTKEIEKLQQDKDLAEKDKQAAKDEVAKVQNEIQNLTDKVREAREVAQQTIENSVAFTRTNTLSFTYGEEMGRAEVPTGLSTDSARIIYRGLIRKAKTIATERGARPDAQYPFTGSAGMMIFDSSNRPLSEDQVESYWVQQIISQKSDQVLVMRASTNRFGTEPVALRFDFYPDPLVFHRGEIVAESRIDGRASDSVIRNTIREFLKTFVNTKARSRKMIPIQSREGESFGQFTEDQYFNAFAQVKAIPRVIRIVAVAQTDIRAGDPLAIDLEFR